MASGQFFDAMALLRVAPLVSSSAFLWYCWDQYYFLSIFLHPRVRQNANVVLPSYFGVFFPPGAGCVIGLLLLSIGTGIANAATRHTATPHLYTAGVCLSAAHFAFVPFVKNSVYAIIHDESKGESTNDLRKWLNTHTVRTCLVDIPGWICFLLATLNAVRAV